MTHTPLKIGDTIGFRLDEESSDSFDGIEILDCDNNEAAIIPTDTIDYPDEMAAFVVQACNAYPALLEASQALLVKLDSIWDWDITPTTTETLDWLDDMLAEEIIKLRNAIAAAEAHDA